MTDRGRKNLEKWTTINIMYSYFFNVPGFNLIHYL